MQTEPTIQMIVPGNLYPIASARLLMGWESESSWRAARDRGLKKKIKTIGKRGYLLGRDLIDFVMAEGQHCDRSISEE